ncbi:MAG: TerD family protein [Bacteroidota bacterium]
MAINLVKGQTINLEKSQFDLSKVTIGLGWDIIQTKPTGLFGGLFSSKKEEEFDLDAVAFLLDANDKLILLGDSKLQGGDLVFFNSMRHPSGQVWLTGDNRTGEGAGDDEQVIVLLDTMPAQYHKIVFVVSIYQGKAKGQHFGKVANAYIRAVDARGKEIARYSLSGANQYENMASMVFAEVYRHNGEWKFRALGNASPEDDLRATLKPYLPIR